jgi:hypothetical protein
LRLEAGLVGHAADYAAYHLCLAPEDLASDALSFNFHCFEPFNYDL